MDRPSDSVPATYFDRIYEASLDPWHFETSDYERGKYEATLDALPRPTYRRGLEVGCSIGVLTALLATRCGEILGVDVSERALDRARERSAGRPGIRFAKLSMPEEMPEGRFDLIVVSEVAYYWSYADFDRVLDFVTERLDPDGHLVLVHWREGGNDKPLSGDEVHEHAARRPDLRVLQDDVHGPYRLAVLAPAGA